LKARLLVEGIALGRLKVGAWKERIDHLYQHDGGHAAQQRYPQEVVLFRADVPERDTIVNVRHNPASGWKLSSAAEDGAFVLEHRDGMTLHVAAVARPRYYSRQLANGLPVSSVVQHLGRNALGVIPNNHCAYFADNSQCKFCEIEGAYRESVTFPQMRKSVDVITEAVALATECDSTARHLLLTAGNLRKNDRTAEVYCNILASLRARGVRELYKYASIMAPETFNWIRRLRDAGLDGVAFNLEFHDPAQFEWLAPGKHTYGRDKLLRALEVAAEVLGRGHSFSNMVFGIQTWQEHGRRIDQDAEIKRCLAATVDLLARGVVPLFTLYHYSGKNSIGPVGLDLGAVVEFHSEYAARVKASGIVPPDRTGVVLDVSSIANHVCNDAFAAEQSPPSHRHDHKEGK
jgi:hypothetical protein